MYMYVFGERERVHWGTNGLKLFIFRAVQKSVIRIFCLENGWKEKIVIKDWFMKRFSSEKNQNFVCACI